jgi:nickel transport protein
MLKKGKKNTMDIRIATLGVCLAGGMIPASAHHAWVAKDASGFKVVYGHEKTQGFDPAKVKEAAAFDAKGKKVSVKVDRKDSTAVLTPASAPAWFQVEFDNGFWTKTTDGSKNISKKGITGYLSSSHSVKYSKSVYAWSDKLTKPVGQKMEVVPASNPAAGKGDTVQLAVTVYQDGKPAVGVPVGAGGDHGASDTTDAQGKAEVRIPAKGPSLIVASRKIPLRDNPDADTLSLSGVLYLELGK